VRLDRGHARVCVSHVEPTKIGHIKGAARSADVSHERLGNHARVSPLRPVPAARLLWRPSKLPVRILRDRRHWVSHPPHRRSRVDSLNRGRHGSHAQPDDIRWTAACVQTTCAVAAMIAGGTAMISARTALADSPTNGATPLQVAAQIIAPARKPVTQDAQAAATDVYPSRCAGIRP